MGLGADTHVRYRTPLAWLSYGLALICGVGALGTFAWQTPGIGIVGSQGGCMPGWLIVFGVLGVLVGVLAWRRRRTAALGVAIAVCVAAIVAGAVVITDQRAAMRAVGVDNAAGDFFGPFLGAADGPDEMIDYGPVGGHSLRMAVFRPRSGDTAAPVVVNVHGGGWVSGNELSDTAFSRYLADRGFLVFNPTYTLATPEQPTWDLAPRQIACALATVNTVSPRYGGSTERLYLTGRSSGANLVTLVPNQPSADECGTAPTVAAVAVNIPAIDPGGSEGNRNAFTGTMMRQFGETYTGGTPESVPERYEAVNSSNFVSAETPPTLLLYGPNDQLVPQQGTLTYAQRARAHGVEIKTVALPWTGHDAWRSGAAGKMMAELTVRWFNDHR